MLSANGSYTSSSHSLLAETFRRRAALVAVTAEFSFLGRALTTTPRHNGCPQCVPMSDEHRCACDAEHVCCGYSTEEQRSGFALPLPSVAKYTCEMWLDKHLRIFGHQARLVDHAMLCRSPGTLETHACTLFLQCCPCLQSTSPYLEMMRTTSCK